MAQRCATGAGLLLVTVILTGCADTTTPTATTGGASAPGVVASRAPVPAPVSTTTAAAAGPTSTPSAPDVLDDGAADAGLQAAVGALTAFSDRERPYETWWPEFSAHLSPEARYAFEGTDPANVRVSAVTDAGVLAAAPSATQMTALVGTDVGQYRVELIRQSVEDTWLVHALTPPSSSPR